uniref:Uncharacterized protein n=1 Tax=Anguilla anguilla TaxID=7936 RepID=A0A0E9U9F6_ANGAN
MKKTKSNPDPFHKTKKKYTSVKLQG